MELFCRMRHAETLPSRRHRAFDYRLFHSVLSTLKSLQLFTSLASLITGTDTTANGFGHGNCMQLPSWARARWRQALLAVPWYLHSRSYMHWAARVLSYGQVGLAAGQEDLDAQLSTRLTETEASSGAGRDLAVELSSETLKYSELHQTCGFGHCPKAKMLPQPGAALRLASGFLWVVLAGKCAASHHFRMRLHLQCVAGVDPIAATSLRCWRQRQ